MGSHGGGTAEGQRRLLESYGITESAVGCPIRSSIETVVVCRAAEGFPVHFDRHAMEADHVLVCNRIKPHTDFSATIESGLMKMLLIGLGKPEGAKIYHRAAQDYSFDQIVRSVAGEVLKRCPFLPDWRSSKMRTTRRRWSRASRRRISSGAKSSCSCSPGSGCRGCRSSASTCS